MFDDIDKNDKGRQKFCRPFCLKIHFPAFVIDNRLFFRDVEDVIPYNKFYSFP